jgi:hypothetical protein
MEFTEFPQGPERYRFVICNIELMRRNRKILLLSDGTTGVADRAILKEDTWVLLLLLFYKKQIMISCSSSVDS